MMTPAPRARIVPGGVSMYIYIYTHIYILYIYTKICMYIVAQYPTSLHKNPLYRYFDGGYVAMHIDRVVFSIAFCNVSKVNTSRRCEETLPVPPKALRAAPLRPDLKLRLSNRCSRLFICGGSLVLPLRLVNMFCVS